MSIGTIINTVFIGPLKFLFEILFSFAYQITSNVGVSIILLSLAMNFLVLPLYKCADAMQEKARDKEMELHDGIQHIKKTFKGDEKMMMLQTYYKQNNYSPLSALSGSVSLLLEIPFFIAAYQFLSNAAALSGATLGPIKDLADPDALITIAGLSINVLPFAMTIINMIASVLFLQGAPLKSKIQLYAMAIFFLVFLYTSPSGLVFYWTLNNVFSLVKTIFYKLKNPKKVFRILSSASGILLFALVKAFDVKSSNITSPQSIQIASFVLMLVLQLPLLLHYLFKFVKIPKRKAEVQPNKKLFFVGALFLALLTGAFIPSTYIAAEPLEFIASQYYKHPNWFVVSSLCLSVGTFLVWFGVFYWLASDKGKVWFERILWVLCGCAIVNYMFFGTDLGNISATLQYDNHVLFTLMESVVNGLVLVALAAGLFFIVVKFKKVTIVVLTIACVAVGGMSTINVGKITNGVKGVSASSVDEEMPEFELSKNGQNVIVIMLDRALGAYFPYIYKEVTERRNASGETAPFLSGFTYYSNVISYGERTNFGSPALLGGYEYTPVELNKRDTEKLETKQNEANLVLPRIFTEQNGVGTGTPWADKAYVYDPVYMGYQWVSDLSLFEEYEKMEADNIVGRFMDENQVKAVVENKYRDFFCFSLMKTMPVGVQRPIYQNGQYNRVSTNKNKYAYSNQIIHNKSSAVGAKASFMENYANLVHLPDMTKVTEAKGANRYVYMTNNITHEPMLLNAENYDVFNAEGELIWEFDNTEYDKAHEERFTLNGKSIAVTSGAQMSHYHTNLLALEKLDIWFKTLQEQGVYDNTRIIISADHAYYLNSVDELYHEEFGDSVEKYFPLLLVKDFNARGAVRTDDTFMTNADVPTLATSGVIENPTNPFTGKRITDTEKTAHSQFIIDSEHWTIRGNHGNTFKAANWIEFSATNSNASIWNQSDWIFHSGKQILKEHEWK